MQIKNVFLAAAAALPVRVAAQASSSLSFANATTTVTTVVTAFTTYCPGATILTFNGFEYTVTEATTLTITECPCTLTTAIPVEECTTATGTGVWTAPAKPTTTAPYMTISGAGKQKSVFGLVVAVGAAALAGAVAM